MTMDDEYMYDDEDGKFHYVEDYRATHQPEFEGPARTIAQILGKTLLIHVLCTINYAHLTSVLRLPTKHKAGVLRLVIFLFFPAIALSAIIIDALHALSRFLENPDETSWPALKFYLHGFLGVRAIRDHTTDEDGDLEKTRLLQLADVDAARQERMPWDWKRGARTAFAFAMLLQGTGTIVLWARRITEDATLSIDTRNFYMACGSVIASIQALLLLVLGNRWIYTPETHGHLSLPRWPETRRMLVEIIIAGLLQELGSKIDGDRRLPSIPTSILVIAPENVLEWVLYSILVLMIIVFRKDIEAKVGLKLRPIGLLLLGIVCGWVIVDAIAVVVEDIIGLVEYSQWDHLDHQWYHRDWWVDPWQPIVPII